MICEKNTLNVEDSIIQVENLGKCYIIGHEKRNPNATLTDKVLQKTRQAALKTKKLFLGGDLITGHDLEEFWALQEVNFSIQQGDSIGIIGRNGAGKSTLLKILSRITEPTTGRVRIRGRVASLLEVGTGFHPELSGRENIFLNGAILGMSRQEVKRKFDEIVDFSGVEKFLDTPVKRYSSGMYVRLAFAIAAHMEPDILIVDEVLAVGDAEFQKKCLGKMKDASQNQGRTILFVSHQMQAVSALTSTCLFLEKGKLAFSGNTNEAITRYLTYGISNSLQYNDELSLNKPKITRIEILTSEGGYTHVHGDPMEIIVDVSLPGGLHGGSLSLQLVNSADIPVVQFWITDSDRHILRSGGLHHFRCLIPKLRLFMGKYSLTAVLSENNTRNTLQKLDQVCSFEVSMIRTERDHPFHEGSSTYLDDFSWETEG